MSQPSRAVLCFCYLNSIRHTFVPHYIHRGDLRKPEFLAVNPLGYVPIIEDGPFRLAESHAILTYLHSTRPCAPHWYPPSPPSRAQVDCYLHWHHTGLRSLAQVVFHKFEAEKLHRKPDLHALETSEKKSISALTTLESWLSAHPYLVGDEITIADISAVCELAQSRLIDYDLSQFPKVLQWFEGVYALEGVKKGHEVLEKMVKKYAKGKS